MLRCPNQVSNEDVENALVLYEVARTEECAAGARTEGQEGGLLLIPNASKLIPKGYKIAMHDSGWLKRI